MEKVYDIYLALEIYTFSIIKEYNPETKRHNLYKVLLMLITLQSIEYLWEIKRSNNFLEAHIHRFKWNSIGNLISKIL